ncbi:hypothetical protein LF1_30320 [Rubripirellula obstinata]|uniref:Putative restriction endonuclease domain-containing protein n=1 Tax=Rubripirellula obstinata TaxID=406547 RepID=A0A5B1CJN3_9BACT|nr:Uma2 family endonuclease [Rubripirellula obstinata]KAA1260492.1 hypothetical protein LF1_30320 [Rubripirellula obstinata]
MQNAAVTNSLADRLIDLGGISPDRVLSDPPPGQATLVDLIRVNEVEGRLCELVDGTLVEKAMGWEESLLASAIGHFLMSFLDENDLGVVTGSDGFSRLYGEVVRGPDVAFISWDRLPDGKIPRGQPIPDLVPDFVVEVLSISNTRAEMARKRREYFQAGVRLIWMVDPRRRTVAVYEAPERFFVADEEATLDGGKVLPGWSVDLATLFGRLDRQRPESGSDTESV